MKAIKTKNLYKLAVNIVDDRVISWDECFINIANVIAKRSKDTTTRAGSVVVSQDNVVLGLGYNGFPRGINNNKLPWKKEDKLLSNTKYAYVVHAEANALYNSSVSVKGGKIYCTLFPCNECAKVIIQMGIKEVIYESDKYHNEDIWLASRKLLKLAKIKTRQYEN